MKIYRKIGAMSLTLRTQIERSKQTSIFILILKIPLAAKSFQVAETFSHEHINVQKHIHKYEYFKDLLKMVIL